MPGLSRGHCNALVVLLVLADLLSREYGTGQKSLFFDILFGVSSIGESPNGLISASTGVPNGNQAGGGRRYAIASVVEGADHIYGAYSIHKQIAKFRMNITQVVVAPRTIESSFRAALVSWLGEENVRTVDKGYIVERIAPDSGMWKGPFNKLWLFNLTDFDKLIVLDADVLIRTNIMHWFDYPAPCAIQTKDDISWNSGAMVIEPNTQIFYKMVDMLPRLRKFTKTDEAFDVDPLNSGYSDQDFITAFFLNSTDQARKRCIMPTEAAVLSSSLTGPDFFEYYNRYRPWVYQTVHFTTAKPWRKGTKTNHPFLCGMFMEWKASIEGIEKENIKPIENNYLENCPNLRSS